MKIKSTEAGREGDRRRTKRGQKECDDAVGNVLLKSRKSRRAICY